MTFLHLILTLIDIDVHRLALVDAFFTNIFFCLMNIRNYNNRFHAMRYMLCFLFTYLYCTRKALKPYLVMRRLVPVTAIGVGDVKKYFTNHKSKEISYSKSWNPVPSRYLRNISDTALDLGIPRFIIVSLLFICHKTRMQVSFR